MVRVMLTPFAHQMLVPNQYLFEVFEFAQQFSVNLWNWRYPLEVTHK
jgi:hypothetical protein